MAAAAAGGGIVLALEDLRKQLLEGDGSGSDGYGINYYCEFLSAPWQSTSVIYMIHQVNKDWSFLNTFFDATKMLIAMTEQQKNSGLVMEGGGQGEYLSLLALRIEAAAEEIAQDLEEMQQMMKNHKHHYHQYSEFLLELVSDCQRKTKHLMTEIRDGLDDHLLSSEEFSIFQLHSLGNDSLDSFWKSFVDSVLVQLESIEWIITTDDYDDKEKDEDSSATSIRKQVHALNKETELIRDYIVDICNSGLVVGFLAAAGDAGDDDNDNDNDKAEAIIIIRGIIDDLLAHVASVIISTAIQSCNYWFHCKTTAAEEDSPPKKIELIKLVLDLHHRIHPTNPKFLELHLNFLKALYIMKSMGVYQVDFVNCFCNYFFFSSRGGDIATEVSSLIILFFNSKLLFNEEEEEDENEDEDEDEDVVVQSFFAEINAVLLETAYFFSSLRKEPNYCPPRFEINPLLLKVCLLKAEIYLKVQLNNINNITTFSDMLLAGEQQFEDLLEILSNLRRFSKDLPDEKIEFGENTLVFFEQVADEVASLYQSYDNKKITESVLRNSILQLLFKIVTFKAESFLMELLSLFESSSINAQTFMTYIGIDQIESFLEQLNFFKLIFSSKQMMVREDAEIIFPRIEAFLRGITSLSYSNLPKEIIEDMIKKTILSYSVLLAKVKKHSQPKLNEIGSEFPLSKLPKTYQLGFIDFLLTSIGELLKYGPESTAPMKYHIQEVQLHLKSLSFFLMKVSESDIDEHPELKDLADRVTDIAYKVEYVIDLIEVDAQWQHFIWFSTLLEELRLVNKQASIIDSSYDAIVNYVTHSLDIISLDMISQDAIPAINEMLVDLSDEEQCIIDQLTRGSSQLVSIVGMPGIGKTTMARKVYSNQNVVLHFHRQAWCTVSQVYEKRELLLEILSDIHGLTNEFHQMSNEDLESKLRQCLLRNKYLIVMDDVWDAGAWNDLKNSFPDVNGSKILITSRLRDVALKIEHNCDPYSLRLFSDDESWKLLEGKVFHGEGCPGELLLVGKEIAQKCEGLPLAVVAIAGLLRRTEKSKELWEKIAEGLSSEIMKDPESRCIEIIELSYNHLPGYLKACFLYLGTFLECRDIPVSKLIRFWLAEGFVIKTESKNLEDVAEAYLVDLINSNLVIISQRRSNRKVKACRLHDLIRDFCTSKAKDENFFQLVTRSDKTYASFPSSDYVFESGFHHHSDPVIYEAYRLSILLKRNDFVESRPSGLGTRSLLFFASTDSDPRCPYDISFICNNFKFLRVLDIKCINMGISFPVEIELLVRLRYLAVSGYVRSIPQSIANLRKLETFVVKGLRGKVVLPDTIWHMTRLRHLHVNIHVAFDLDDEELGGSFQLENLVSFSCPSLSCGKDTVKVLKKLPNLRKLRCIFFESWDSSKNNDQFPGLNFLNDLESVKISYYGTPLTTSMLNLPLNLKELTLSMFRLPWDHISAIGRLPKLEVLKLLSGAFEGPTWEMRKEEFLELKFLKLDTLNIAQWHASCGHLPKLERLVLQNCKDLEKIPHEFADITTLEMIEVHWCGQSAEKSAKEFGDENGEIKVLISSSY